MIAPTMPGGASETRAVAGRVAKALREKGRNDEALAVLSASAAAFGNDPEGQALLAEAFRIDQNSALARMAFERMEGVKADHTDLDAAIAQYSLDELTKLERVLRPSFRKAQVGFNNNVKYKGAEYHIQTEDSGLDKPHIITHLFADGGRIIRSHKRVYGPEVTRADVAVYVRTLMKGQHMEMVLALREGKFDEIFAGKAPGGVLEVLEAAPKVDLDRVGNRSKAGALQPRASSPHVIPPTPPQGVSSVGPLRARLHVARSLYGGPEAYDVIGDVAVIGSQGAVQVAGERFCHPKEAALVTRGPDLYVDDYDGGNGVFLRIGRRVEIGVGDEFVVGDQLLRLARNPDFNDAPDSGPTYFRSSMKWSSAFRVTQVFEGGAEGSVAMARGNTLQIGSANDYANDLILHGDTLVSAFHCVIEEQADSFILTDLGARSGVFVRVAGKQVLQHGSELLVGRTRLLVDLSPSHPELSPLA